MQRETRQPLIGRVVRVRDDAIVEEERRSAVLGFPHDEAAFILCRNIKTASVAVGRQEDLVTTARVDGAFKSGIEADCGFARVKTSGAGVFQRRSGRARTEFAEPFAEAHFTARDELGSLNVAVRNDVGGAVYCERSGVAEDIENVSVAAVLDDHGGQATGALKQSRIAASGLAENAGGELGVADADDAGVVTGGCDTKHAPGPGKLIVRVRALRDAVHSVAERGVFAREARRALRAFDNRLAVGFDLRGRGRRTARYGQERSRRKHGEGRGGPKTRYCSLHCCPFFERERHLSGSVPKDASQKRLTARRS